MNKSTEISCGRRLGLFLLAFSVWLCILNHPVSSDALRAESADEAESANKTEELTKIRTELEEKRKSVGLLHQREKNAYQELLELEQRLHLTQRFLRQLKVTEQSVEREQKIGEKSLGETDIRLRNYIERSKPRWRELYKHRKLNFAAVIFDASSPLDLLRRFNLCRMVLKRDRNNLERIQNLKEALEEKERNLIESRAALAQLKRRKTGEEIIYSRERGDKEWLLKQIRSEKSTYAQAVGELEKAAAELESLLAVIQPRASAGPVEAAESQDEIEPNAREGFFIISKGKLPWPVNGKVASRFGEQTDPKFQTKIRNTGIEIESVSGEEVVAVSEGRVIYSSGLRGYGNMVILEHDDGYYTLYARLSEIWVSPDQKVDRLQTIGTVGENGLSLTSTLHFEIREGRQAQNPLEWLRK